MITLTSILFEQDDLHQGISLTPTQARGLAGVLDKLGLSPEGVIEQQGDTGVVDEADDGSVDAPEEKAPKAPKVPKQNISTNISPEAIELAKQFYEDGKKGGNWYYDAAKTLGEAFTDEQERVLFALLLAATSVQNEIYNNFIEAAVLFNAVSKDARENIDLLTQWAYDPDAPGMDQATIKTTPYMGLNIYKEAIAVKIINLGAKFPNISKAIQLFLQGRLDKQAVKNLIASSVELVSPTSFNSKSPFFRKLKIANFALTIVDPEFANSEDNWFNVVVDTWMYRAFYPGATKEDVDYLFGQEVAYANVARVVSNLAKEAGVSPHVMQAAIWLSVKLKIEGDAGGLPDYLAAIRKLVSDYGNFWDGITIDAKNLKAVIQRLDTGVAKDAIAKNRGDILRGRIAKSTKERHAAKAEQDRLKKIPGQVDQVKKAEELARVMQAMKGRR